MLPYVPEIWSFAKSHIVWKSQQKARKDYSYRQGQKGYARRLEIQYGAVPSKPSACNFLEEENDTVSGMGWALPQQKAKSKFNDKQKQYLGKKFEEGEITGRKLKADEVAQDMRRAKDEMGKRIFTIEEFLTSKQVASFFSRLSAKNVMLQLLITKPLKLKKFERRRAG